MRPGREADHSPPSSTEVKNAWAIPPLSQYVFMAWCLVNHSDYFTFYLMLYNKLKIGEGVDSHIHSLHTSSWRGS
jgi:hypothetical protein